MKLAEALLLRADLQKKLANLKTRIGDNVKVQDGDVPSEDPIAPLDAAEQVIKGLYELIAQIHQTNAAAVLPSGQTLLSRLVERDELSERHRLLQYALDQAKVDNDRYSHREIKWQKTIKISDLQQQVDEVASQLRRINVELQASNWQVDLLA